MITRKGGFTFIELCIAILIIGFVAMLGIMYLREKPIEVRQSVAKTVLKQIYEAEKKIFDDRGSYVGCEQFVSSFEPAGFQELFNITLPKNSQYGYIILLTNDAKGFRAIATTIMEGGLDGNDDLTPDVWQMDETGKLICLIDDTKY